MTLIPEHNSKRLVLRAYQPHDLDYFLSMLANREVIRYLLRTDPWPQQIVEKWLDSCQRGWEEHGYGFWILEHKTDNRPIGWGGLNWLPDTEEIEVLYALDQPYWGQGLATEVARFSVSYGFEVLGLKEIIGLVVPENIASARVLEKAGLKLIGSAQYFGFELLKYLMSHDNRI
jgi:ribosomal-protein-alanine N-acetyltransferase